MGESAVSDHLSRRLKAIQVESTEKDVAKQIGDLVRREIRARKQGLLEPTAERVAIARDHLVVLPEPITKVDEEEKAAREQEQQVGERE